MRRLLVSNLAVRAITTPIALVSGLVSAWLAVGYLGAELYASIILITTLSQLLPFADMGVGAAVINEVAAQRKGDRSQHVYRVLVSAQRILLVAGAAIILAAILLAIIGIWPIVLGSGSKFLNDPTLLAIAFFGMFSAFIFFQLGYRVLTGIGKNQVGSLLSCGASILSVLLIWGGVALELAPVWFVMAQTISAAIFALVASLLAGKWSGYSYIGIVIDIFRPRTVKQISIRGSALPMLVIMAALPALLFGHKLILSHVSSSNQLVAYTFASQIYAPAWAAVSGTLLALWPAFAAARSVSSSRDTLRVLRRTLVLVASASALASLALVLVLPSAALLIGHGQTSVSWWLAGGFGALIFAQSAFYPLGVYLTRDRELRFQAICVALMLVVGLPACIGAAKLWGAPGPVWVSAVSILTFQLVPALIFLSRNGKPVVVDDDGAARGTGIASETRVANGPTIG
ncbi:hypothetical protein [Lacisediminihabitans changchengi]|uniref:Polysaccharide biosynthesis protein n=1 Tax=Lacisediminihabitans changchengi TaxID=2787634 RepID=A0A934SGZ5_9MICO|nr:hypothetical protein [Lacisediminihabitans changchengi]MBK4346446.1 hypothetical protein [Lacisediminihabitans changchengi]MBK4348926.1 hypothetical protein [Lacisediminihabitans changchengi]